MLVFSQFTYDIYIQLICSFLDSIAIEVIAEDWTKYPLLTMRSFWVSIWDTDFCVYLAGRKERDNPSGLYITDTDYCIYVSPDILTSLFLGNFWLCWILRITFCVVNLFLCISFCILPTRDIICYCLSPSDWFCLVYDPLRLILVTIIGTISVAIFHDWVIVHCMYVHIFFNL